ncbi:MAG: hypothetical protein R2762_14015, partial [Bryobacteraceae bacterium]
STQSPARRSRRGMARPPLGGFHEIPDADLAADFAARSAYRDGAHGLPTRIVAAGIARGGLDDSVSGEGGPMVVPPAPCTENYVFR